MRLCLRVEVHLCILLQLFVRLMFFLSPSEFTLRKLLVYLLKECRLSRFNFFLMSSYLPLEFLLSLFSFGLFLLKDIEKSETMRLISLSSMFHFLFLSLLFLLLSSWQTRRYSRLPNELVNSPPILLSLPPV